MNKEELQKKLNAIKEREWLKTVRINYPKFKKLEGKYFKTRNSYGSDEKWWLYKKVTRINKSDLYMGAEEVLCYYHGWQFQICSHGQFRVEQVKHGYVHCLDIEISEKEFNNAYNKSIEWLDKTTDE